MSDLREQIRDEVEYRVRTAAAYGYSKWVSGRDYSAAIDREIQRGTARILALLPAAPDGYMEGYYVGKTLAQQATTPAPRAMESERYVIINGWLCENANGCTCAAPPEYGHEIGCGYEPVAKVEDLLTPATTRDVGADNEALAKAWDEGAQQVWDDEGAIHGSKNPYRAASAKGEGK